ncbi:MAG: flavin reductase family protein [Dehalococcoidales bacterium]|nr:flavin reductase family protein [Dehalococcoidales bacterium]
MPKIQITPQPLICTTPTVLVGSMVNGKSNFMAVAWCGVANSTPPMVSVAIRKPRHTLKGILEFKEFSVNIPSASQAKEADYCGIVSGAKVDKTAVCGFKIFTGKLKNAPLIEQCPVNLACTVVQIVSLPSHELVIGEVKETHVSENCLTDGKPDMKKIQPFVYSTGVNMEYISFGESLGKAFVIGKEMEKS